MDFWVRVPFFLKSDVLFWVARAAALVRARAATYAGAIERQCRGAGEVFLTI